MDDFTRELVSHMLRYHLTRVRKTSPRVLEQCMNRMEMAAENGATIAEMGGLIQQFVAEATA